MKKMMLCLVALSGILTAWSRPDAATEQTGAQSEWLQSFTAVEVSAQIDLLLIRVPESEAPKIIYDTKGSYTTKFRFEVKDRTLRIAERTDSRRTERTVVTVFYNRIDVLTVSEASVSFGEPLEAKMLDLTIGGGASVKADLQVRDLKLELTGQSSAKLTGVARYLTMYASTGTVAASELEVTSARVHVTTGATVSLDVRERLEATTSTGGNLTYKNDPEILRSGTRFMGGKISKEQ